MPEDGDIHIAPGDYPPINEVQVNISGAVVNGQKIYTTVKCFNGVNLSTTQTSDGVIVVAQPPDAADASVTIQSFGGTGYPILDTYQFETDRIRAYWNGFVDPAGIAYYEVRNILLYRRGIQVVTI